MNSLYFAAVQLLLDGQEKGETPQEFQMNQWTYDNIKDEIAILSPLALVECECGEEGYKAKILDVPVAINENLKDTDVVLLNKKEALDKPTSFVVRL